MAEEKDTEHAGENTDEKTALTEPEKAADQTYANDFDNSTVKFVNGGADHVHDTALEIDDGKPSEFVGLTKEELMKYSDDPYWKKVRWVLFIGFWVVWVAMLVAAVVIIVIAPKCPPRPDLQWWQKDVIYHVYPKSFKDTNGDGFGDIKGIEENVGYLNKFLNASALWLSPVYPSPMVDGGYDVEDYKDISPVFGTLADFDSLVRSMHKSDMKLIMDFIPNHTSRNHTWFQQSRASGAADNEFKDFYVWNVGKTNTDGSKSPPNNWVSRFGGPAWTLDDVRGEFYYHQFLPDQPDLNLRNPRVLKELESVLRFWVDRGVDGFRLDAAAHLFESNSTADEPASGIPGLPEGDFGSLTHTLTQFQPESYVQVVKWREFLDTLTEKQGYKALILEVYGTANETAGFYNYEGRPGANLPMNMALSEGLKKGCNGLCVRGLVESCINALPGGTWFNWQLGSHDVHRVASRVGELYTNVANVINLLLPGTPITYYGEEIGMVNGNISFEDTQDTFAKKFGPADYQKHSRDPERTPMQWNHGSYAGFTTGDKPWLPVNPDYPLRNVKAQRATGAGKTHAEVYAELSMLRKEPSFQWGKYSSMEVYGDDLYAFAREAPGFPGFLVAVNFGDKPVTADFYAKNKFVVPKMGEVVHNTADRSPDLAAGSVVDLNDIHIHAGEGLVFKWKAGTVEVKKDEE